MKASFRRTVPLLEEEDAVREQLLQDLPHHRQVRVQLQAELEINHVQPVDKEEDFRDEEGEISNPGTTRMLKELHLREEREEPQVQDHLEVLLLVEEDEAPVEISGDLILLRLPPRPLCSLQTFLSHWKIKVLQICSRIYISPRPTLLRIATDAAKDSDLSNLTMRRTRNLLLLLRRTLSRTEGS
jgi:hypothetical protein